MISIFPFVHRVRSAPLLIVSTLVSYSFTADELWRRKISSSEAVANPLGSTAQRREIDRRVIEKCVSAGHRRLLDVEVAAKMGQKFKKNAARKCRVSKRHIPLPAPINSDLLILFRRFSLWEQIQFLECSDTLKQRGILHESAKQLFMKIYLSIFLKKVLTYLNTA